MSADQNQYIINKNNQIFKITISLLQIISLIIFKSFIIYLIINILLTILNNYCLSKIVDKNYEYIKYKGYKLSSIEKKEIKRYIGAGFFHKVGSVIVSNTDNILISTFVGTIYVGIYSNYLMILGFISVFLNQIFIGLTGSVGNLSANYTNKTKSLNYFYLITYFNSFLVIISMLLFLNLVNPFIELWIGREYVLSFGIVVLITNNFYLRLLRNPGLMYLSVMGLNWNTRYIPIAEATINLVVSILLLKYIGLAGVFLGTLFSTICTVLWSEPYILFKVGFKENPILIFKRYILYYINFILSIVLTLFLNSFISVSGFHGLIIKAFITIIVTFLIFITTTNRLTEFKELFKLAKTFILKIQFLQK